MFLDNLFTDLIALAIILYIGLAIYMRNKGIGLKEVILEAKEAFKK